jgi:hypothetical protein
MSPADFEKCVADGGKVITKKVGSGKYLHICYDSSGKSHAGEIRELKKKE